MSIEKYQKSDPGSIQKMFGVIAKGYDRTNFILSGGLNLHWNRILVNQIKNRRALLDLCAGTGKVALSYLEQNHEGESVLLDFCQEMLDIAEKRGKPFADRFKTVCATAEEIPFPDQSFDVATIAYGIRNISNLKKAFCEVFRVLEHDGSLVILELTRPTNRGLASLHEQYLKRLLPFVGKLGSGSALPYKYLSDSILRFLAPEEIKSLLFEAGFSQVTIKPLFFGIATLITATKP